MDRPRGSSAVAVQPPTSRIHIEDAPGRLTIEIGSRSRWYRKLLAAFAVLWCGLFFLAFAVGAGATIFESYLAANRPAQPDVITTLICLPAMLLFMLAASFLLLRVAWWNFTSVFMRREVITINPFEWLIERDFGLWQGRHHLQSTNLSNLQLVLRDNGATIRNAIRVYTDEPGSISVRHKRSRVALAFPATEAEARQIISAILRRVPGLARLDAPSTQKRGQAAAPSPWRIDQNVDELVVTLPVEQRWRSQLILIWYLLFGVAWVAGFGVRARTITRSRRRTAFIYRTAGYRGSNGLVRVLLGAARSSLVLPWPGGYCFFGQWHSGRDGQFMAQPATRVSWRAYSWAARCAPDLSLRGTASLVAPTWALGRTGLRLWRWQLSLRQQPGLGRSGRVASAHFEAVSPIWLGRLAPQLFAR